MGVDDFPFINFTISPLETCSEVIRSLFVHLQTSDRFRKFCEIVVKLVFSIAVHRRRTWGTALVLPTAPAALQTATDGTTRGWAAASRLRTSPHPKSARALLDSRDPRVRISNLRSIRNQQVFSWRVEQRPTKWKRRSWGRARMRNWDLSPHLFFPVLKVRFIIMDVPSKKNRKITSASLYPLTAWMATSLYTLAQVQNLPWVHRLLQSAKRSLMLAVLAGMVLKVQVQSQRMSRNP